MQTEKWALDTCFHDFIIFWVVQLVVVLELNYPVTLSETCWTRRQRKILTFPANRSLKNGRANNKDVLLLSISAYGTEWSFFLWSSDSVRVDLLIKLEILAGIKHFGAKFLIISIKRQYSNWRTAFQNSSLPSFEFHECTLWKISMCILTSRTKLNRQTDPLALCRKTPPKKQASVFE